ncbi:hypothetical protein FACS1894219_09330 [Clostridia bacterium]|nr:hypothetical protein FACS1894219_09330 [Clostridia bacterium]
MQNNYIQKKDDGTLYVLLSKIHSTFWYNSNYCYIAEIKIITKNDTHCAVEFIDDYTTGDEIIVFSNVNLTHGQDIYVIKS